VSERGKDGPGGAAAPILPAPMHLGFI